MHISIIQSLYLCLIMFLLYFLSVSTIPVIYFCFFIKSFGFNIFELRFSNEWWNVVIKSGISLLDILFLNS
jgi:hypothetical protein